MARQFDRTLVDSLLLKGELPAFFVCRADYCRSGGYFLEGGHPKRAIEQRIRLVLATNDADPLPTSAR
jgi:hypothetical protein